MKSLKSISTTKYSNNRVLNSRVAKILSILNKLQDNDRYRACLIFGSIVRGEFAKGSDVDVKVVIRGEKHEELNHLNIYGIKLDISFNTIKKLREETEKELEKAKRIPIVAESIILFDKDGKLGKLVEEARGKMSPKRYDKSRYDWVRFVILNEDLKVSRHLATNPIVANHVMHTGLGDILDMYYQIAGRWHVSNKKTLKDLEKWDLKLKSVLVKFLSSKDIKTKFSHWAKIIDHVLKKVGGRIDIEKTGCECEICSSDLAYLKSLVKK